MPEEFLFFYYLHILGGSMKDIRIHPSWKKALREEFEKPYWQSLTDNVREQYRTSVVYPPGPYIFRAFDVCPLDRVKVVIIGQDPYHGVKQANGLSFSVNTGLPLPPSLKNIYKEIQNDLGITPLADGDLIRWGKQGVLLLNSVLTVLAGKPGSHAGIGWETFTDAVIRAVNTERTHVVYMLWGKYAQNKGAMIDTSENLVLTSAHPSPYSVSMFYGHHHFSRCNTYLSEHGMDPIDWR